MCEIDWSLFFDIVKSVSIIIASIVAVYGINSWRRETKWKRKYELAEEVLSLFYEVQEAISIIRSPLGYSGEGQTRKRTENEDPKDTEVLDRAYTVIERYEKNKDPFNKLRAIKFRFKAVFGKETAKPFNRIAKLTNKILTVSTFLGNRYWKDQGNRIFKEGEFEKHLKRMHEYEAIIWEGHEDGKDEIKKEVSEIIKEIEEICTQIIRKK